MELTNNRSKSPCFKRSFLSFFQKEASKLRVYSLRPSTQMPYEMYSFWTTDFLESSKATINTFSTGRIILIGTSRFMKEPIQQQIIQLRIYTIGNEYSLLEILGNTSSAILYAGAPFPMCKASNLQHRPTIPYFLWLNGP